MIRLLEAPTGKKKIPVILILRQTFGYNLAEANRIATSWPQDLPHIDRFHDEKRIRKELVEAGCVLDDSCPTCFGRDPQTRDCGGCYRRYQHASFYPPLDYKGPICGSMYAFTTMCGRRPPVEPRVHSGLSDEEREAITSKITCPECREALVNWGYMKGDDDQVQ